MERLLGVREVLLGLREETRDPLLIGPDASVIAPGRDLPGDRTFDRVLQVVRDRDRPPAPVDDDHVVELRDGCLLGLHVDGLDVKERVLDRDDEEIPEQDVGPT